MERVGPAWRFGIQQLIRDPGSSGGQLMAFALTALAIAMVALIRFDLIATWETQVPTDAPNTFALNITDDDQVAFIEAVTSRGGDLAPLYPIVRGRLETVNEIPLIEHLQGIEPPGSVRRELSLTESGVLGRDNQVDRGRFFTDADGPGLVTVESKLFDELDLQLGDIIHYTVGPDRISAEVVGSRVVQWDSMLPNFFMIFSPGTLAPFESTRLTSLRLLNPAKDTARDQWRVSAGDTLVSGCDSQPDSWHFRSGITSGQCRAVFRARRWCLGFSLPVSKPRCLSVARNPRFCEVLAVLTACYRNPSGLNFSR